jgi:ATP-dependent protease ClpP protease subunit
MSLKSFTSLRPTADLPQLLAILGTKRETRGQKPGAGWYTISNVTEAEAEIYIYDEIGDRGVSASDFASELREIKAKKIALHINSLGGNVWDGIAIFNALRSHPAEITVWIDGMAGSAASFIAMAGNEIIMAPHSTMMIHEASGLCMGPADEMARMAGMLNQASDNIAGFYAKRAGGTIPEWRERMKAETFFSDHEAVAIGLADRVDGEDEEDVAARAAERIQNSDTPIPFAVLDAVRASTSDVVRKQAIPQFDLLEAIKEGVAA